MVVLVLQTAFILQLRFINFCFHTTTVVVEVEFDLNDCVPINAIHEWRPTIYGF